MRNTRSSRAISSCMAWVMASMYVVSAIPVSVLDVEPASRVGGVRHRGPIRLIGRRVDLVLHALPDRREIFARRDPALDEQVLEPHDCVLPGPLGNELFRNVRRVVMLSVSLHTKRLHLDQRDATARARVL